MVDKDNASSTASETKDCFKYFGWAHKPVFGDIAFASHPPQFPWICIRCGAKGWSPSKGSNSDGLTYSDVFDKFKKE